MALTQFESGVKVVQSNVNDVYSMISDLNNLERVKDRLPADKVSEFSFDQNSVSINVSPIGNVVLRVVDREPGKCVKFQADQSPVPFNLWIQVLPVSDVQCKMKLTVRMELNPFVKLAASKTITEGVEKIANLLALVDYKA